MRRLLERIFGLPLSAEGRASAYETMVGHRSPEATVEFLRSSAAHNTEKSGALLGAQGIFVVVDIFAIEHGWPRSAVLASLLLLVAGSLVVMTNLRSTLGAYHHPGAAPGGDPSPAIFRMILGRHLRFNIALYLSFLSIMLLGLASFGAS